MNIHALYRPFLEHFRRARLARFYSEMSICPETKVLDIGGSPFIWDLAERLGFPRPKVTLVNLLPMTSERAAEFTCVAGDARCLPFRDQSFDVAFSNSVIEHLGSLEMQKLFASEVLRVSCRHFVQTPNQEFFFEPHFLTPFIHWVPLEWRRRLVRRYTVWGLLVNPSQEAADLMVREIRLLRPSELRMLFPDDQLLVESFFLRPKSLLVFDRPHLFSGFLANSEHRSISPSATSQLVQPAGPLQPSPWEDCSNVAHHS